MRTRPSCAILVLLASLLLPIHARSIEPETITRVANDPGKFAYSSIARIAAEVVAIDAATRRLSLRGESGNTLDVVASDAVRNFAQIAVGDRLNVEYVQAVTAEVRKTPQGHTPAAASVTRQTDIARAVPGQSPAGAGSLTVTALVDVVAVDRAASTVTIKGPKGNPVVVAIQNPAHFDVVKVGDQVEIVYIEAMAIAIGK